MNTEEWNVEELISGCKQQDSKAQRILYEEYAPVLLAICRRYVQPMADAEDVFADAMVKIYERIDQYEGKGSFEGWMKRIAVNESLMFLRKNKREYNMPVEEMPERSSPSGALDQIQYKELLTLLDRLPNGYRTVFNMYVLEGYKHREIAEALDISINTSKSQLIQARKRLKEFLREMNYPGIEKRE